MNDVMIERISQSAKALSLDLYARELAGYIDDRELTHEELKAVCEEIATKYGLKFLYRDFRVGFREGQAKAREIGLYMQKYCGCIFSEEDRYSKQINKDKAV